MQKTDFQQVFLRNFIHVTVLRLAGAKQRDHFRCIAYRPFLGMELRGLPEPDAAAFMDRGIVFPDLLHFCKGLPYGCSYRCNANKPPSVRTGTVQRRPFRNCTAGARLPRGSRRILRQIFWMVCMGRTACTCYSHPAPCAGVCFGQRMAAGKNQAMADICLDGCPICMHGAPSAGSTGALERQLFYRIPFDIGNTGSCLFHSHTNDCTAMHFIVIRHKHDRLSYWRKKEDGYSPQSPKKAFLQGLGGVTPPLISLSGEGGESAIQQSGLNLTKYPKHAA